MPRMDQRCSPAATVPQRNERSIFGQYHNCFANSGSAGHRQRFIVDIVTCCSNAGPEIAFNGRGGPTSVGVWRANGPVSRAFTCVQRPGLVHVISLGCTPRFRFRLNVVCPDTL